ncbi:MAG: alkaline phosphatase [Myxococcota bacterium]|nr:alkaline phosphatase [Myxococcota bacterium]
MRPFSHLALLFLMGCNSCQEQPAQDTLDTQISEPGGERNVVVLILDGLRIDESFGDGYSDAAGMNTEDIMPIVREQLLPQGTLVKPGYSTGITITAPGHSDMITGVRQTFANYPNDEGEGAYLTELPTLFEELRAQHGLTSEQVLMGSNALLATPLRKSIYPGYSDLGAYTVYFYQEGSAITDPKTLLLLRDELETNKPRLTFVNLHSIDRAGHYEEVENYGEQAQDFDTVLVNFWEWLQEVPGYGPDTILVLTADHGRHRNPNVEESWRSHGDQCSGCRELPLFLVGPGIKAGVTLDQQYTLPDLTATLAWLLETDLSHGEGIVMSEVLEEPPEESVDRAGVVYPSASGGVLAAQRWQSTTPRSVIEIDGTVVSSEDIFTAERPRLQSTSLGTVACWRELSMVPGADEMPWLGACALNDDTGWSDMGFPQLPLFPLWAPTIREDSDGALWMSMITNSGGAIGSEQMSFANIWLLGYDPEQGAWDVSRIHDKGGTGLIFPTDVRMAVTDEAFFIAYGTSAGYSDGRKTRRIDLYSVLKDVSLDQEWERVLSIGPSSDINSSPDIVIDSDRLERPALEQAADGTFRLGFLSYHEDGTINVLAADSPNGLVWSTPELMDDSGRVLAHVDPMFSSADTLLWAELSASDTVEVCSRAVGGTATCTDTGAAYIMGLTEDGGGVTVSVRQDASTDWELVTVAL